MSELQTVFDTDLIVVMEGMELIDGNEAARLAAKKDRSDAAVKAVLLAANETRAYIVDWTAGSRARDRGLGLVRLWTDAAVAIRRKDPEFAHQLRAKAEYWTDPERWTQADVDRVGIRIDAVAARARSLLSGGISE